MKDETVKAIASVRSTVKNLRTWLEEQGQFALSPPDFFELLINKLTKYFQNVVFVAALTEYENNEIEHLAGQKYMRQEWTFKK